MVTREDLQESLQEILAPVISHFEGTGLHLGNSGAHYAPRIARMEGWSRLLWGLAPLAAGGSTWSAMDQEVDVLRRGTDPSSPDYWGIPGDCDQRLVEMAAIALSLMIAPAQFWDPLSDEEKKRLYQWLSFIEVRELPANNWHFFRVLVCAAFRSLGLPVNEAAETASFALIESCYRGDGWYMDGNNGNYDLYNPFGFHFYGLVYAKLIGKAFPERAATYIERARLFAPQYTVWFREDGSMVPYGRSLTYRFASVSFFSACVFADLEVLPWGVLKGIILRTIDWWLTQPIRNPDGILSVGFAYPNLVMAEQYNSPGSPYWALKSYLVLALPASHPFWQVSVESLPTLPETTRLAVPGYIISRSTDDVQLLCPGRYPGWEAVQSAAKYCKFAYSARFGFSVSHGAWSLEKAGGDSMLMLSEGDGYWRERRHTTDQCSGPNWTYGRWFPWKDVEIQTTLVALGCWHVRIHRIKSARILESAEGGFSIPRYHSFDLPVTPEIRCESALEIRSAASSSIAYPWAASAIVDLSPEKKRAGDIVMMEPNLNILETSGAVPVLRCTIPRGLTLLVCAVRAGTPGSESTDPGSESTGAVFPGPVPQIKIARDGTVTVMDQSGRVVAEISQGETK